MVASGDWLTPRLNGVAHYDKPPLAYWSIAAGIRVLGVNEWGARIGAAVAGVTLLLATAAIAGGAFLAPLVLASAPLFFALTRLLATDVFLAAAVAAFYAALLAAPARGRGGTLWMFVAMGVGFLAKGPVVLAHTVLPLAALALWKRHRALFAPLGSIWGWLLFLAIAAPWYLSVVAATPGLLPWLAHHELWMRYTSTIHHRPGPPWYFVLVVVAGLLPWTFAAFEGIGRAARNASKSSDSCADAMLLSWAIVPVLFFSASGSKLPAYVLPEIPAFAILAARALERPGVLARWGTALFALALAGLIEFHGPRALAGVVGAQHAATLPLPAAAHVAAGLFLTAAIAMAVGRPTAAALAVLGALYGLLGAAKSIEGPLGSVAPMTRVLERARQPDESVIELGVFSAGLPFYTQKIAPMVDVPRREAFEAPGASAEPFLARKSLPEMVARDRRVWVFSTLGRGEREADALGLHYTSVARTRTRELGVFEPMP
ncbi:MAG TPA: glycosyltransferase family 39 protein [Candidatus Eisenbacteria bacterium]|jgi:4-amino-4-deoxy-L-arabinose transferase-like glycosyltransferase|nr:glycosyltransferase family 39 protein [Candidatus Eisenbacteria bacterium]